MSYKDFIRPVTKGVTSQFVTATAVARHVRRHGSGVILAMAGGREAIPLLGGSHVAWAALAGLCRQLAAEFGPDGVRVSWLLSPGSPGYDQHDQLPDAAVPGAAGPGDAGPGAAGAADTPGTASAPGSAGLLLRHLPSYDEVANIAVFA